MTDLRELRESPFLPLAMILSYLALIVTTLHLEVSLLLKMHIELLLLLGSLGACAHFLIFVEDRKIDFSHPLILPSLLAAAFLLSPLLTSFFRGDELAILGDGEYKSFVKILIFAPFVFYFASKIETRDLLLNGLVIFYGVLSLYFLYRFFILQEARAFDARPTLNIRHGDPNFLCAFFAMTVPLTLMQARNFWSRAQREMFFLFVGIAVLLVACALITESRMGFIALLTGLFYLGYSLAAARGYGVRALVGGSVGIVVIVGILLSQSSVLERFSDIQDKSSVDRILTYKNGLLVFMDKPLLGAGMNRAKDFYYGNTRYPDFQTEANPLVVHNTYLSLAADLGVLGVGVFLALLVWSVKRILESSSKVRPYLMASIIIMVLAGMTVGMGFKDLIILQIFLLAGIAQSECKGRL